MASIRQEKFAALIRKELGNYFVQSSRNYGPGILISITMVRVAPDLGHAKVYLSIFGNTNPKEMINEIRQRTPEIRMALGKMIGKQVRIIPELSFHLDDSAEYAEEIDRLLRK